MALHFSTYIYPVMYTYKTSQNIFVFDSKFDLLILRYILGNACIAITYISYEEKDVHIVNISNGNNIYHVL